MEENDRESRVVRQGERGRQGRIFFHHMREKREVEKKEVKRRRMVEKEEEGRRNRVMDIMWRISQSHFHVSCLCLLK